MAEPVEKVRGGVRGIRTRRRGIDHAVRAYDRNSEVQGSQLAAAITYFGFLSFFPLLALGFSILGYVVTVYPDAESQVRDALNQAFPSVIGSGPGQVDVNAIANAKAGAGIVGLLGLLYAGLGWVDALREAMHRVFGLPRVTASFVKKKAADVFVLVVLGLAVLASLAVSGVATEAISWLLDALGLGTSIAAKGLAGALTVATALFINMVIFAVLLSRLSGTRLPFRRVQRGALLGAVGFEVLKLVGTYLVGRTTSNPLYASFALAVGLLVWINLVSKLLMFVACFVATEGWSGEPHDALIPGPTGQATGLAAGTEPLNALAPTKATRVQGIAYPDEGAARAAAEWAARRAERAASPAGQRRRRRRRNVGAALLAAAGFTAGRRSAGSGQRR
jgi:membrane protein